MADQRQQTNSTGCGETTLKFQKELKGFEGSKGTIRFTTEKPLPMTLVKKLVKARIAENNG